MDHLLSMEKEKTKKSAIKNVLLSFERVLLFQEVL